MSKHDMLYVLLMEVEYVRIGGAISGVLARCKDTKCDPPQHDMRVANTFIRNIIIIILLLYIFRTNK